MRHGIGRSTASLIVGLLATGSQLVLFDGCGGTGLPAGPVVNAFPPSFNYTTNQQAYAVLIGESLPFSSQIQDDATNPLTVNGSCTLNDKTGAFKLMMPCPGGIAPDGGLVQKLTINQKPDYGIVQVLFTPTDTIIYDATITISTNGLNDGGLLTIGIHALGVSEDAGIPADAGVLEDAGVFNDAG